MPRHYKRKSERQSWSRDAMLNAIRAVKNNEMGWLRASKVFNVPQATLRRHALNKNKDLEPGEKKLGNHKPTIPPEVERQLVEHLKFLESRFFGLTRKDVLELAYQLAVKNGFKHQFNDNKKVARKDWLREFRRRNPDISLRKPEATSAARAQAFNRPQVADFFKKLNEVIERENINPMRIFNADESGLSKVQRPQKVFATTGRKQVGAITSAERGSHVTVVCAMSSNGNYVPPALIFARKNLKQELGDNVPPGTLLLAQESGWMTGPVFLKYLEHFQKHTKANVDDKILLIVDGHSSHKYLEALLFAKANGIVLLCLPPHCTHHMQPLDVSFFGPLKTYYDQEISKWLKNHPGKVVTQFQIGGLFNEAYCKAASVQNAINGFAKTGIVPFNPDIFPDYMYEAAETTNIPLKDNPQAGPSNKNDNTVSTTTLNQPMSGTKNNNTEPIMNTAPVEDDMRSTEMESKTKTQVTLAFTPFDLSPPPEGGFVSGQGKRKQRKRQGTCILNSTPNLEELKEKNRPSEAIQPKRKRNVTRKLLQESESENEKEPFSEDDDNDYACIYCTEPYKKSKKGEEWIQCITCKKWAHADCAGVNKRTKIFICELCR